MTTFYVGQRVRCVAPWRGQDGHWQWRRLRGVEAVVNAISAENQRGEIGVGITALGEDDWVVPTYGLEPILPSGHQPAELSVEELLPFLKEKVKS